MQRALLIVITAMSIAACVPAYKLMSPGTSEVAKGNLRVTHARAWNKAPKAADNIAVEETWTLNGPVLDAVEFIGGVEDGDAIVKQKKKDTQQVPAFRANMTPPELVSMIESYYRIKAGATVFETTSVQPVGFLDRTGMQVDFDYIAGDDVPRRGRCVLAVIDDSLYMMALNGTRLHYFDSALAEFEAMVQSARRN